MKIYVGKHRKAANSRATGVQPSVVLDLSLNPVPKFKGFSYSVEEGLKLAKRSFTEIPGLLLKQK